MLDYRQLESVQQVSTSNPEFTEAKLRWLIFNAKENGLDSALVRIGRRIYFDIARFNAWLEQGRGRSPE